MALLRFLMFWGVNVFVLWVSSEVFSTMRFDGMAALLVSGLLFGIAHTLLKPVLVLLTLPITVLTLGLFLLVVNGLILALVAWIVPGFHLGGFGQAVLVALFISILSFILNLFGLRR